MYAFICRHPPTYETLAWSCGLKKGRQSRCYRGHKGASTLLSRTRNLVLSRTMIQHRLLNVVDVALVASVRPRAGKQEVIPPGRKSYLTALMTALSGADRSSTVTSQWQPRSSKESSAVMPVSTEEEKQCLLSCKTSSRRQIVCPGMFQTDTTLALRGRKFMSVLDEIFKSGQFFFVLFYCQLSHSM